MVFSYEHSCGRREHSLAHRVVAKASKVQQLVKQRHTVKQLWNLDQAFSFLIQIIVPSPKHPGCDNLGVIHYSLHFSLSCFFAILSSSHRIQLKHVF